MTVRRRSPSANVSCWSKTIAPFPFERLRLSSSRDYRRPAEACVTVESDGVTLVLDPTRSDLLVDAELARFADLLSADSPAGSHAKGPAVRRFRVSAASLARGISRGMSPLDLGDWFTGRTGREVPAAVQLLLAARTSRLASLLATRRVVVTLPSVVLLDGLIQHPATGPLLGERLGPFSVSVPEDQVRSAPNGAQRAGHRAGRRMMHGESDSCPTRLPAASAGRQAGSRG